MKKFDLNLPKIARFFRSYQEFKLNSKIKGIIGDYEGHLGRWDMINPNPDLCKLMYKDVLIGNIKFYIGNVKAPIEQLLDQSIKGKYLYVRTDIQGGYLTNNPYDFTITLDSKFDGIKVSLTNEKTLYDVIVNHYKYVYDYTLNSFYLSTNEDIIAKRFEKERIRFEILRDVGDIYDLISDQSKLLLDLLDVEKLNDTKKKEIINKQLKILSIVRRENV